MKTRPVIEVRVRIGDSVVLQADSDRLFYTCIYGGYKSDGTWTEILGPLLYSPDVHLEMRAIREVPINQRSARMRKLRRRLSVEKSKTN